jgi:lysyl endopeptidase
MMQQMQPQISMSQSVRGSRLCAAAALLVLLTGGLAAAPAAWAQGSPDAGWPQTFGSADDRQAPAFEEPLRSAPSLRFGLDLRSVPQVALPPLDVQALLREDEVRARDMTKALRYGVGRAVHAAARDGNWYRLPDGGRLWVLEVVSPGALGVRLHLADLRLPRAAQIAVYAPNDLSRTTFYDGDQPSLGNDVWTPTVLGERARIEVHLPPGSVKPGQAAGRLPFTLDRLQHLYLDPVAKTAGGKAGACHNDVSCYPEWADVARAVGGLGTIFDNNSLYCTGELLDSGLGDHTPYFLTANHCLRTQTDAHSAEVFWLYQTATCGGPAPSLSTVPRSGVATLLSTGVPSDYTLLMIEGALPRNLFWAGWTAAPVDNGTASADIHHPGGDYKRISFGDRSTQPALCESVLSDHVRVNWTSAPTEPGSSGSGIYRSDTHQLYGQLHCGPSACGDTSPDTFYDVFGAFSSTYPHIASLLAGGSDDSFEPNETCEVARRAAVGTYQNLIVKDVDPDWFRLNVPAGRTLTVTVNYTRDWGNIGIRLYGDCNATVPLVIANGPGNTQTVTIKNTGSAAAFYRWQVFLRNDTRNSYTMTVSVK